MPYGIKANIRAPHKFMRMGALCWLRLSNPGSGSERIEVKGMSRGGRMVETWVDARDLENFRPGWTQDPDLFTFYDDRAQAQAYCDGMNHRYAAQPLRAHVAKRMTARPA